MIARVASVALVGMEGYPIDVEVSLAQGLPVFTIVGLPDPSIQEARERVRAAIQASREEFPLKRVTVNLSPAHLRKAGSSFDLAMALGVLAANGRLKPEQLAGVAVLGELSLDGAVRPVRGVLPSVVAAVAEGNKRILVARANAPEAALVSGAEVFPVEHLAEALRFLRGDTLLEQWSGEHASPADVEADVDLSDVRGQVGAKYALEVAAAGGHNLLMLGPPGGGKTMLARRIGTILPPMTEAESFEVTRIYSVAGLLPTGRPLIAARPFRAPHHSGSMTGLVGGGSGMPFPGEVSLAHRGILFLDEYGEFRRQVLDALRQPLEDGCITIVRSRWAVTFPARFQMIAASNPCPCGHLNDAVRPCVCMPGHIAGYRERMSGPIADRIDLAVEVARLEKRQLFGEPEGDPSVVVAERVAVARARQRERWRALGLACNAEVPARDIDVACRLTPGARRAVEAAIETMGLTARGAHRAVRVARTIADLDGTDEVLERQMDRALSFRVAEART